MDISRALRLTPGDVVALVGGGGKTSAMFQLASELVRASPKKTRVLTTTSTRIFAAQIRQAPAYVTFDPEQQTIANVLTQLDTAVNQHGQVLLIGRADRESGKAFGIPPDIVDELAGTNRFDIIINEADGSRMRPLKAPAEHEPVIPTSTTVVVPVAGIDALGRPLNDETVHRAALVSRLSGTPLGQRLTVDTIATVLSHPQGGLKHVPAHARVIPLLNKVENPTGLAAARHIAARLLAANKIDSVAIGAVQRAAAPIAEVQGRTAAVVLAGGGSSRFGSAKQLARWQGQTFIERVVDLALAAATVQSVIVVLGAEVKRCQAVLANRPVKFVINERWADGQSTSMQAGLAAVPANVDSVVFLLVDLPGLTATIVDSLIERYRKTLAPIVWPEFEGRRGNPVLFDRSLFPELMQIRGDTGGRPLVNAYQAQAERVAVTNPAVLLDVDRPEDLQDLG